ncbi:MAG: lasso peptide [Candidatus Competibacteraceae bacterium]|nr:lasso peptide [Candidatus Competibacteraceae bacterium]
MKKIYVAPQLIVHGKVEEITQGGKLPHHPIWNPWGHDRGKGHDHGHGHTGS